MSGGAAEDFRPFADPDLSGLSNVEGLRETFSHRLSGDFPLSLHGKVGLQKQYLTWPPDGGEHPFQGLPPWAAASASGKLLHEETMRKAPAIAILLLVATTLSLGVPVEAQSPPHVFVGEVMLDGARPPDGTPVQAVLNGRPLPRAEATIQDGKYTLIVEQPHEAPAAETVISFAVGDFLAHQSRPWELGEVTLLTLTATSTLLPVPVEIDPPLPERLLRGQEFMMTVKAHTGLHRALGWTINVEFDPSALAANFATALPEEASPQYRSDGPGKLRMDWTYDSPIRTAEWDGELVRIPLRVLDSAPSGGTSLAVSLALTSAQGSAFPLDPDRVTATVIVASLAADLNGDDVVDIADLAALASAWGTQQREPGFRAAYDLDSDGTIWIGDLAILVQSYRAAAI